jgi:hypothetical protein
MLKTDTAFIIEHAQAHKPTSQQIPQCLPMTDLIYAVPGVDWSETGGKPKRRRREEEKKRSGERGIFIVGLEGEALEDHVSFS